MKNNNQDENKFSHDINIKKQEIKEDLEKIEKYVYDLETKYLEITQNNGNILKGWEQNFNTKSKINTQSIQNTLIKRQKFSTTERIFSQSSVSNPFLNEVVSTNIVKPLNIKNGQLNKSHSIKKKKKITLKKKRTEILKNDMLQKSILNDL
jgi:hypothetical protein